MRECDGNFLWQEVSSISMRNRKSIFVGVVGD